MAKLAKDKTLKLITTICDVNGWEVPRVVFYVGGLDFGFRGILHLNPDTEYDSANELLEHLTILLSSMNCADFDEIDEHSVCSGDFWHSKN